MINVKGLKRFKFEIQRKCVFCILMQLRRGADRAEIYSLAFSSNAQWLAVSSDKGTVHVFTLKVDSGLLANDMSRNAPDSNLANPSAIPSLSFMKGNTRCNTYY